MNGGSLDVGDNLRMRMLDGLALCVFRNVLIRDLVLMVLVFMVDRLMDVLFFLCVLEN